tara:strand:+ start:794 stop:1807 length:1014 start_codon:yes stop_codon:yes gene_type:complete
MHEPYYICAQPATFYYAWQVDAMLLSFEKLGGVNLSKVHIVCSEPVNDRFLKVKEKWSTKGVVFAFYKDERKDIKYISSVRPHLLEKHWLKNPWLRNEDIFYHDCDIALTRPLKLRDKLTHNLGRMCYVSNTISYIGAEYIEGKGHNLLQDMCDIVDIPIDLVREREDGSGGAQYLLKKGIDASFWRTVYRDSENLFHEITRKCNKIASENKEWHPLQIWCADMWAVLWNLWKKGYNTDCHEDLNFSWGTSRMKVWEECAIFHNAGVTKPSSPKKDGNTPFYKGIYINNSPLESLRPSEAWASQKYFDLVTQSFKDTDNIGKPIKKRIGKQIKKKFV